MRKLLRDIHGKFLLFFLSANGAKNPQELPLIAAKRTDHAALPAIAFEPQHSEQRPPATQRANSWRCQHWRHGSPPSDICSIRLQKRPRKKLRKCPNLLIEQSAKLPIRTQKCDPRIGRHCGKLACGCGQLIRSILFHERKKIPEVRQKMGEV